MDISLGLKNKSMTMNQSLPKQETTQVERPYPDSPLSGASNGSNDMSRDAAFPPPEVTVME